MGEGLSPGSATRAPGLGMEMSDASRPLPARPPLEHLHAFLFVPLNRQILKGEMTCFFPQIYLAFQSLADEFSWHGLTLSCHAGVRQTLNCGIISLVWVALGPGGGVGG